MCIEDGSRVCLFKCAEKIRTNHLTVANIGDKR